MTFLPSKRMLWLLAAAAPLFVVDAGLALVADTILVAAAVLDAVSCPGRRTLRVRRVLPARVSLDAGFTVRFHLVTDTGWPVRVRLTDDLPVAFERDGDDVLEVVVPARRDAVVDYRAVARERGERSVGDIHIRVLGRLGLVWRQRRDRRRDAVLGQPGLSEVERYRALALRHHSRDMGLRSVRMLRGEGSSFESLREYVPGDDPRSMDWKATARRGRHIVRQYEAERSQNVLLAIDAGRLMTERIGGRVRLDHALAAALLLADVARLHGDRVGVFVFADRVQQFLPPSHTSLDRIAEALGRVEERGAESDYPTAFAHLGKRLQRRSLLVVFTDIIDARASAALLAHLGSAGKRHLPLAVTLRNTELEAAAEAKAHDDASVYRRAAAEELILARAGALAAMQRTGILVADTRPHAAIATVLNRYLDVKKRGLL